MVNDVPYIIMTFPISLWVRCEIETLCADTTARRCTFYLNQKVPVSSAKTSMFWSYLFPTNIDIPAILGSQKLAAASTLGLLSLRFDGIRDN